MVLAFTCACGCRMRNSNGLALHTKDWRRGLKRAVCLAVLELNWGFCLVPYAFWVCCAHLSAACETAKVVSLSKAPIGFSFSMHFVECTEVLMPLAASIILPRLVSSVRMPSWRAELLRYLSFVLPGPLQCSPHQTSFGKHGDCAASRKFQYQNSSITWGTTVTTWGHSSSHYSITTCPWYCNKLHGNQQQNSPQPRSYQSQVNPNPVT